MCGSERQGVCEECSMKCWEMHGKKPSSSPSRDPSRPLSFFKIMIGDFREAMFLPPKVARTVDDLVNENATLEDSNGLSWIVKVLPVGESVAFQDGWREFVLDHSIQVGELVIFKQIRRSHFSAQIYSASACERVDFLDKDNINLNRQIKNSEKSLPRNLSPHTNQCSEPSEEDCLIVDEDSARKKRMIEADEYSMRKKRIICELPHVETVCGDVIIQGKDLATPRNSSPHSDSSSRRPQSTNDSDGPLHRMDKDVIADQETGGISPSLFSKKVGEISLDRQNKKSKMSCPTNLSSHANQSSKSAEEDCFIVDEVSARKKWTGVICEFPHVETAAGNVLIEHKDPATLRNSPPPNDGSSRRPQRMNDSDGPFHSMDEDVIADQETGKISLLFLCSEKVDEISLSRQNSIGKNSFPANFSSHTNQSYEPSEEDCFTVDEDSVRRRRITVTDECSVRRKRVIDIASCELPDIGTTGRNVLTQLEDRATPRNSSPHIDGRSRRPQSVNYSDGLVHMTDEDVIADQVTGEISPLSLSNAEVEEIMAMAMISSPNDDNCGGAPNTPSLECDGCREVPLHSFDEDDKVGKEIGIISPISLTASDAAEAKGDMVFEATVCVQEANVMSSTTLRSACNVHLHNSDEDAKAGKEIGLISTLSLTASDDAEAEGDMVFEGTVYVQEANVMSSTTLPSASNVHLHNSDEDAKAGKQIGIVSPISLAASDAAEAQGDTVFKGTVCVQEANLMSSTTLASASNVHLHNFDEDAKAGKDIMVFEGTVCVQEANVISTTLPSASDVLVHNFDEIAKAAKEIGIISPFSLTASDATKTQVNLVFEGTVCAQEAKAISSTTLPAFDALVASYCPQDTNDVLEREDIVSNDSDKDAMLSREPAAEQNFCKIKNETAANWDIILYHHQGEGSFEADCIRGQNIDGEDPGSNLDLLCRTRRGRRRPQQEKTKCADEEENVIAANKFTHTLLVTEEGICHKTGGDFTNKVGSCTTNPIDFSGADKDKRLCVTDTVTLPRKSYPQHEAGLVDPSVEDEKTKLPSACEVIEGDTRTTGNLNPLGTIQSPELGTEGIGNIGSAPHSATETYCTDKEVDVVNGKSTLSGKVPDLFREVDEKKVASSLEETIKAIKTESMDLVDPSATNSPRTSFSLVADYHSHIELAERLPYRMSQRMNGRKVVILRDPLARLWPVLYYESNTFVGLLGGWETFASANKLKRGDLCVLELAKESEPIFRVYISKALD